MAVINKTLPINRIRTILIVLASLLAIVGTVAAVSPARAATIDTFEVVWAAINDLYDRLAGVESRLDVVEEELGITSGETLSVIEPTENFPEKALLVAELVGKIEVRYRIEVKPRPEESTASTRIVSIRLIGQLDNLSDQEIQGFYYKLGLKDSNGNLLYPSSLRESGSIYLSENSIKHGETRSIGASLSAPEEIYNNSVVWITITKVE
ncbi:MAG: hypothetical protein ABIG08_03585 [bacterium]